MCKPGLAVKWYIYWVKQVQTWFNLPKTAGLSRLTQVFGNKTCVDCNSNLVKPAGLMNNGLTFTKFSKCHQLMQHPVGTVPWSRSNSLNREFDGYRVQWQNGAVVDEKGSASSKD
jgi:hypothetical protein